MKKIILFLLGLFTLSSGYGDDFEELISNKYSTFNGRGLFTYNDSLFIVAGYNPRLIYNYDFSKDHFMVYDSSYIDMRIAYFEDRMYNHEDYKYKIFNSSVEKLGHVIHKINDTIVFGNIGINMEGGISFDNGLTFSIIPQANESILYYSEGIYLSIVNNTVFAKDIDSNIIDTIISTNTFGSSTYVKSLDDKFYITHNHNFIVYTPESEDPVKIISTPHNDNMYEVDIEIISENNVIIKYSGGIYRYNGIYIEQVFDLSIDSDLSINFNLAPKGNLLQYYKGFIYFYSIDHGIIRSKDFYSFDTLGLPPEYPIYGLTSVAKDSSGNYYGYIDDINNPDSRSLFKLNKNKDIVYKNYTFQDLYKVLSSEDNVSTSSKFYLFNVLGVYDNKLHLTFKYRWLSGNIIHVIVDINTLELLSAEALDQSDYGYFSFDSEGNSYVLLHGWSDFIRVDNGIRNFVECDSAPCFRGIVMEEAFLYESNIYLRDRSKGIFVSGDDSLKVTYINRYYDKNRSLIDNVMPYNLYKTNSGIYTVFDNRIFSFDRSDFGFYESDAMTPINLDSTSALIEYSGDLIVFSSPSRMTYPNHYSFDNGQSWDIFPEKLGRVVSAFNEDDRYVFGTTTGTYYIEKNGTSVFNTSNKFIKSLQISSLEVFLQNEDINNYKLYNISGAEISVYATSGVYFLLDVDSEVFYKLHLNN
jgi:hypothetical protein